MANHTSIRQLFQSTCKDFEKLRQREVSFWFFFFFFFLYFTPLYGSVSAQAFMEQFRKQQMFREGLEEFDDSYAVVQSLIEEYKAAEGPDYVKVGRKKKKRVRGLDFE